MTRSISRMVMLAAVGIASMIPAIAVAGGPAVSSATGCPAGTTCDLALGVALTPPAGWGRIPPDHFPPHTLAWFAGPPLGLDYNVRLLIGPDGTTTDRNDASAAATAAGKLIAGYRIPVPATRRAVRYGGAPGVLVRGLPGSPEPDAIIILAHAGALYSIIALGAALAPDQRQALASLRFISRIGPFPPANPPAPVGPRSHRTIPGGVFTHNSLRLTPGNGIRRGSHTYSLFFHARTGKVWVVTYSVPCVGQQARLVINIRNAAGAMLDRVLHRAGRAMRVRQMEEIAGPVRLDVRSHCPRWSVVASGVVQ